MLFEGLKAVIVGSNCKFKIVMTKYYTSQHDVHYHCTRANVAQDSAKRYSDVEILASYNALSGFMAEGPPDNALLAAASINNQCMTRWT